VSASYEYIQLLEERERLLKELERLKKFWLNDASYRAPEDKLQGYALGRADAFDAVIHMLKEGVNG
jgi:hypothetical protein